MAAYILRNLDPELWAGFKARAAAEGRGQRWIVLTLIAYYVEFGLPRRPLSAAHAALERLTGTKGD